MCDIQRKVIKLLYNKDKKGEIITSKSDSPMKTHFENYYNPTHCAVIMRTSPSMPSMNDNRANDINLLKEIYSTIAPHEEKRKDFEPVVNLNIFNSTLEHMDTRVLETNEAIEQFLNGNVHYNTQKGNDISSSEEESVDFFTQSEEDESRTTEHEMPYRENSSDFHTQSLMVPPKMSQTARNAFIETRGKLFIL